MNPLISVIIPVYMVEKYLDRCVQSVIMQSYTNMEIILVDDGSNDYSAIMCDNYVLVDDRIQVIHKQNGGLSDARNVGINFSSGEYIVFVDSDDYIKEDMVETLYNLVLQYRVKLAVVDIQKVDENEKEIDDRIEVSPIKNGVLTFDDCIRIIHQPNSWRLVVSWNKIYHREIFNDIHFPIGKKCEDEYVIAEICWRAGLVACVEKKEYFYLVNRKGAIINTLDIKERYEVLLDIYVKRYNFFEKIECNKGKAYALDSFLYVILNYLVMSGKRNSIIYSYVKYYVKHSNKNIKNIMNVYFAVVFRRRII